ncbi:MAG: RHS repeat-associated core domain-containing protein [Pyrinomonadaceae bacterium]|nr:RHS repeat-associated core domain-containing protein [Pyrinomonadaceae bacterium]
MRVELYDASGTLASAVEYDYDAMARLIRRQVDTNGNGTFDSAQKFVYDGTQVTFRTSAGVKTKEVTYKYDAFDRRIAKDVDTNGDGVIDGGERFIYDGGDLVLKTDAAGTITNRYLHGPDFDQVFADESSVDDILWALADNLGTVRDWIEYNDTTGTTSVFNHLEYDAFGNIISQTNSNHTTQFGFTGQDWDADVGLYYYSDGEGGGRWYDPVSGTFMKPDDAGFTAGDVNLSRYVGNSPTNWVDPNGMEARGYVGGVVEVFKGYGDAAVGTVGGIYFIGRHPIQAAKGIGNSIRHPVLTFNAICEDVSDKSGSLRGQGELAGDVLIGIASGGAAKAASKTGTVAKLTSKLKSKAPSVPKPAPRSVAPKAAINPQKQAGHIPGTPQHVNRIKQGKASSTFHGEPSGEMATQIANQRGTLVPGRPNLKEYDFGVGIGTGPNGGTQTCVRVHTSPKTGQIHGHPSGPEKF